MKAIPFLALFAMLILSSSYVSTVITHSDIEQAASNRFKHFRIQQQGNAVALSWAVATPDVSHFIIERSLDGGEVFEPVSRVNYSDATVFKYNDAFKAGNILTYRMVAVKSDGTKLPSARETIRMVQHN
jgi:hypothetical protein